MTSGRFRFFIGSNVILDYFYGEKRAKEVIEAAKSLGDVFINGIVLTEVSIRYLKDSTGKKSYTLKHSPQLVREVDKSPLYSILDGFSYLSDNALIGEEAIVLMDIYGLLPNDAIILATCKFYGIDYLISFDTDFKRACDGERITLVDSKEKLEELIKIGDSQ
ncbi:type II toxin-antitoxin system VapC family toxin [Thermococcus sp. M36]|uniref:type II toxin-antitoxin system VapC family toxin n=1 Tax=Thermococcus sp. M36 TaxID=1638261 RepID=UPI001F0F52FE|nr:type II toxin-antitoxin system VapC family toxin [Thermococcus sp. M36]